MAEPEAKATIQAVRIVQETPIIFVDGVMSQSYVRGLTRFYLYRTDLSPDLSEAAKKTVVAQLVMSAGTFAGMLHFLEHRLKIMVADGAISQAEIDEIRKTVYPTPAAANVTT